MTLAVFLAGLASALAHALWNALARSRRDPGSVLIAVTVTNGALCLPVLLWVGLPPVSAWGWVVAGAVLNLVTMRALMETYRRTPFAFAYPLVRGIAPLFVSLFGFAVFGDTLTPLAALGVGVISTAVILLALSARGGRIDRAGLLLAMLSGVSNAGFVITDMQGVRLTGDPIVYGFTLAVANAISLGTYGWLEGLRPLDGLRSDPVVVLASCVLSMVSYLLVLYGLANGPAGAVSALRETSIFIGVVLAAVMLKERVGPARWIAATMAVAGVALIRLG